jgi:exopolysaccharide biosynthesis WecB/TagA/CpsF family protein
MASRDRGRQEERLPGPRRGAVSNCIETFDDGFAPIHEKWGEWLASRHKAGDVMSVTWLNHSSAQSALRRHYEALQQFDLIGIDGKYLQWLLHAPHRTSADLVVPQLLRRLPSSRIGLIGGTPAGVARAANALTRFLAVGAVIVFACDGFDGLPRGDDLARLIKDSGADCVLVGLGAGLQEEVAIEATAAMSVGLALTCGGFLDQVQHHQYYPRWAYPLRLNWSVRLAREPRRLYRRYSLEAAKAWQQRHWMRERIAFLPGYGAAQRAELETRSETCSGQIRPLTNRSPGPTSSPDGDLCAALDVPRPTGGASS